MLIRKQKEDSVHRIALVFSTLLALTLLGAQAALSQQAQPVCHGDQVILPNDPAYGAHAGHGDPAANADGTCRPEAAPPPPAAGDGGGGGGVGGGGGGNGGNSQQGSAAQAAAAPPSCNGTVHLSGTVAATNGNQPKYSAGDAVYARGRGFDRDGTDAGSYTITDINDKVVVTSGQPWAAPSGTFALQLAMNTNVSEEHEYQVVFFWTERLPNGRTKTCRKSKNFFLFGSAGAGVLGTTAGGTAGALGAAASGGEGGVLGTSASGEDLPFTGIPAWLLILVGLPLFAIGLAARKLARET
jgi:hypothetical protein